MKRGAGIRYAAIRGMEALRADFAYRAVVGTELALLAVGALVMSTAVDDINAGSPDSWANLHRYERLADCWPDPLLTGIERAEHLNPTELHPATANDECNFGYTTQEQRMLRDPFSAASIVATDTVRAAIDYGACFTNPGGDRCMDAVLGENREH